MLVKKILTIISPKIALTNIDRKISLAMLVIKTQVDIQNKSLSTLVKYYHQIFLIIKLD